VFKQYRVRDYDFKLIFYCLVLSGFGIMIMGSAKESLQSRQALGVLAGVVMMIVISFIDYNLILKFYWIIYILNIGALCLTFTGLGDDGGGATRWVDIFGLRFQPSESAKILLILFFAQFIMVNREKFKTFKFLIFSGALAILPWFLIYKQPDLSTSICVLAVLCIMIFLGGLDYRFVVGILAIAIPVFIIGFNYVIQPDVDILENYQKKRILAFIDPESYPDEAMQQLNSVTAIASGMLDGKGYKNNEITSLKNGNYIIEPQTDFIFAVIGEEFGFKGSVAVIIMLGLITFECLKIAQKAKDLAGLLVAAGMGSLFAVQGFINIGVNTFLLPDTGIPLPFVSSGLTSIMSLYIGMGVVLNVRLQAVRKQSKFYN